MPLALPIRALCVSQRGYRCRIDGVALTRLAPEALLLALLHIHLKIAELGLSVLHLLLHVLELLLQEAHTLQLAHLAHVHQNLLVRSLLLELLGSHICLLQLVFLLLYVLFDVHQLVPDAIVQLFVDFVHLCSLLNVLF